MQRPMIDAKKARETRMVELSAWRSVEMDYLAGIDYRPSTLLYHQLHHFVVYMGYI